MLYVKILLIAGGGAVCWMGIQEYRVSSGTKAEPLSVKLAEIEAGNVPSNNHINLDKHLAVYEKSMYSYSQSKYNHSEPGPSTSVDYVYYPVVSSDHAYVKEWAKFAKQRKASGSATPLAPPMLKDFAVLVKTRRFKTVGDLKGGLAVEDSRQGLIINEIDSLDKKESELIKQSFPNINLDKVLILEDGRKPSSALKTWGMILGGAVLVLAGVGLAIGGVVAERRSESKPTRRVARDSQE